MPLFLSFAESIQLVPDGTLFLHIAIILVMVFILNRTLFKPINGVLEGRERRTHGRSDEAKITIKKVEESLQRYERTLKETRIESYQTMERQRAEALGKRQQEIGLIKEDIAGSTEKEKDAIRLQSEGARATLENEARRIATNVSSQILGRSIGDFS